MRPLALIGYGFLFVAIKVLFGRYDVLVDPLGWVLVLWGLRRMAGAIALPAAMALAYLGVLALLCSVPLWWPDTAQSLHDGDPSVLWAMGLGELLFSAALCHSLATLAQEAKEGAAVIWFRICEAGLLIGAVTPPLYFGAHVTWLKGVGNLGALLQLVVLILCFVYSGRAWTGAVPRPVPAADTDE